MEDNENESSKILSVSESVVHSIWDIQTEVNTSESAAQAPYAFTMTVYSIHNNVYDSDTLMILSQSKFESPFSPK